MTVQQNASDFCCGLCLGEDLLSGCNVLEKCKTRDDATCSQMRQSLAPDDGLKEAKVQTQDTLLCGRLIAYSRDKNAEPHSAWRSSPSRLDCREQGDFNTFSFQQRFTFAFSIQRRKMITWAT